MMMDYSDFEKYLVSERINRSTGGGASYGSGIFGTDQAAAFTDDAGYEQELYEEFARTAKPGFNVDFAKQIGSGLLGLITGNPLAGLIGRGIGALGDRFSRPGIRGGINLRGDSTFDTFGRSTSFADFAQRMRDKRARETAAMRGSVKDLQSRIDRGDFGGSGPAGGQDTSGASGGAPGGGADAANY